MQHTFANVTAAGVLADGMCATYTPNPENTQKYAELYAEYLRLSAYFAEENKVMHKL